jgi:DNA-binding NtrC family response regulator
METPETITLLVVDTDQRYVAMAQNLLSKYQGRQFNLIWKQDGESAIEELVRNPSIAIVLLDYSLSGMNGLEVTKAIREKKTDTPIIFLTSNRDFRLAIEAMRYGVEDCIVKDDAVGSVLPRTIINILERVELRKKITAQQKKDLIAMKRTEAIKELIVTVCHEFNNPLAAMKICTDILSRQDLPKEEKDILMELDKNISMMEKEITKLRVINFDKLQSEKS